MPSLEWVPYISEKCLPKHSPYSAPCLMAAQGPEGNIVQAQEIIYPAYSLRYPRFVNLESEKLWVNIYNEGNHDKNYYGERDGVMGSLEDGYVNYPQIPGQNLVFENAIMNETNVAYIPFKYKTSCLQRKNFPNISKFDPKQKDKNTIGQIVDEMVVALSTDSFSFQHFMDHAIPIIVQSETVVRRMDKAALFLRGRQKYPTETAVFDLLRYLNITNAIFHNKQPIVRARRMVYSCRAPYLNPYITLRTRELLLQHVKRGSELPLSHRKTILYLQRKPGIGKTQKHGGRVVLNEKELISAIEQLLIQRNRGENLKIYNADHLSFEEQHTLTRDVSCVIGPHGGAFYLLFTIPKDSLVLEFMPKKRFSMSFWEISSIFNLNYYQLLYESETKSHDMRITNVGDVVGIMRKELGKVPSSLPGERTLKRPYYWTGAIRD
eukprot:Nk52_evm9s684 gene=Nk52_evmTU9s684